MRRVDHAGVYLLTAGTYTPVSLIVLDGAWRLVGPCWFASAPAPRSCSSSPGCKHRSGSGPCCGITLGWAGVAVLPQLAARLDPAAVALLGIGGLAYTAGAIIYLRRRPNPLPAVFGYHELFHAMTIVAVACQYVAIAFFVIRAG